MLSKVPNSAASAVFSCFAASFGVWENNSVLWPETMQFFASLLFTQRERMSMNAPIFSLEIKPFA